MKTIPSQWRTPISFGCIAVINGSMICFPHTARLPHLLAAGAFFIMAFLSGDLRRLLLGFSLCLMNIILIFVQAALLTELSIYLLALIIGLVIIAADKRRENRKQMSEPYQTRT